MLTHIYWKLIILIWSNMVKPHMCTKPMVLHLDLGVPAVPPPLKSCMTVVWCSMYMYVSILWQGIKARNTGVDLGNIVELWNPDVNDGQRKHQSSIPNSCLVLELHVRSARSWGLPLQDLLAVCTSAATCQPAPSPCRLCLRHHRTKEIRSANTQERWVGMWCIYALSVGHFWWLQMEVELWNIQWMFGMRTFQGEQCLGSLAQSQTTKTGWVCDLQTLNTAEYSVTFASAVLAKFVVK